MRSPSIYCPSLGKYCRGSSSYLQTLLKYCPRAINRTSSNFCNQHTSPQKNPIQLPQIRQPLQRNKQFYPRLLTIQAIRKDDATIF